MTIKIEHNEVTVVVDVNTTLEDIEVSIIKAYLAATGNNISKVSRLLDISRQTIYNKLNGEAEIQGTRT